MSLSRGGALASGPRATPHVLRLAALIFIVSVSRYVSLRVSSCLCVCVCVQNDGDFIKCGLSCACSPSRLSVV